MPVAGTGRTIKYSSIDGRRYNTPVSYHSYNKKVCQSIGFKLKKQQQQQRGRGEDNRN